MAILLIALSLLIPPASWAANLHIHVMIFWYMFGCVIRIHLKEVLTLPWRVSILATAFSFFGLLIVYMFRNYLLDHYFASFVQPFLMIAFLWFGYDTIDLKRKVCDYPKSLKVMFLVYCMHLIVICWFGGLLRVLFGVGPAARLGSYFFLFLTFWIDVVIANIIRRTSNRVYLFIAGGR